LIDLPLEKLSTAAGCPGGMGAKKNAGSQKCLEAALKWTADVKDSKNVVQLYH